MLHEKYLHSDGMCLPFLLLILASLTSAYYPIDAYGCDCSFGFLCSGGGCPIYQLAVEEEPQKEDAEMKTFKGILGSGKCCRKCWDGSTCCLCGRCAGC